MKPFFRIEQNWYDSHIVQIKAEAASALFAGTTEVYTTYESLKKFAAKLEGFPKSRSDKQSFEAGTARSTSSLTLLFFRKDSAGHIGINVGMKNEVESAHLEFTAEAAAVDRFQTALLELCRRESGSAELEGVGA
jgi:hypothetical protein